MNDLGVVIGIAIAVGLGAYFWRGKTKPTPSRRLLQILIVLAGAAVGFVGGQYVAPYLEEDTGGPRSVDRTLEQLKQAPLVRLVIADVPTAEARIRTALEEDRQKPVTQGATRAFTAMSELRATYIVPSLKASDDPSALAAVAARTAVLRYLQATNLATCREFAVVGIQRVDQLDAKAQELFRATLTALEGAYRSGRDARGIAGGAARPMPSDEQARALLVDAGFQPMDFDKMQRMDVLADVEACALAARINTAPTEIAADKAGGLARYLLSSQ